jgi:hypothetical protein
MSENDRRSGTENFERFLQAVTKNPEKLRNLPAIARELGIGESTAYKYRQRLAQMAQQPRQKQPSSTFNGQPSREETGYIGEEETQPRTGLAQPEEEVSHLPPEEVDQEIAKILHMAGRISGLKSVGRDDAYIAQRLRIAVEDIGKTLNFAAGYRKIEERVRGKNKPAS